MIKVHAECESHKSTVIKTVAIILFTTVQGIG